MPAFLIPALKHWKLIGLGLLCLALAIQTVRLGAANNRADRLKFNLNETRAELKAISTKKNEQLAETERRIKEAERGEREVRPIVKIIREAPIKQGTCETPGLDILKNEI